MRMIDRWRAVVSRVRWFAEPPTPVVTPAVVQLLDHRLGRVRQTVNDFPVGQLTGKLVTTSNGEV